MPSRLPAYMAYKCLYCGTSLTHTSQKIRKKHLQGKKHRECVAIYWLQVGKEIGRFGANANIDQPHTLKTVTLDQTTELNSFKIPGLHPDAEKMGVFPGLPPPANIPTAKFPRPFING